MSTANELVLAFIVGVYTSDGIYIQTYSEIAELYFKSGRLVFDLLTAAPITWAEFIVVFAPGCDEGSQSFAYIKAPLRYVEKKKCKASPAKGARVQVGNLHPLQGQCKFTAHASQAPGAKGGPMQRATNIQTPGCCAHCGC